MDSHSNGNGNGSGNGNDAYPDGSALPARFMGMKQSTKYERLEDQSHPHPGPPQLMLGGDAKSSWNTYVIACCLLASMNSILLGYDVGVISGAVLFIKEDLGLTMMQEEVLVSTLTIVSLVGAAVSGRFSDAVGRRRTMAVAAVVFLMGALVMGLSSSFTVLMAGRVLAGVGVGFALMIAPVYTAEVAPAKNRGALVSLPEVFINVGILLGYVANYALAGLPTNVGWRVMLGLGTLPSMALAIGVLFMPESPRWLVMQGRIEEAAYVLLKTSSDKAEADQRLMDIMEAAATTGPIEYSLKLQGGVDEIIMAPEPPETSKRSGSGKGVWRELVFPNVAVRRMMVVGMGIQFFQQATGIDAVVYYSTEVFKESGMSTNSGVIAATVVVGFVKTLFILVATFYLDRLGRRPLLLTSSIGITFSLFSLALTLTHVYSHTDGSWNAAPLVVTLVCFYVAFFSVGFGPIVWVLTSEIFPLQLRAQAMSVGIVVNRVASGVVSLTFLSVSSAITLAGTYFLFTGISLLSVVFVYTSIPETKGKTLEEVSKFFYEDMNNKNGNIVELGDRGLLAEDKQDDITLQTMM